VHAQDGRLDLRESVGVLSEATFINWFCMNRTNLEINKFDWIMIVLQLIRIGRYSLRAFR